MLNIVSLALLVTSALALPQSKESNDLETRDAGGIKGSLFKEKDGLDVAIEAVPVFMFGPSKDKVCFKSLNMKPWSRPQPTNKLNQGFVHTSGCSKQSTKRTQCWH